MFSSPMILVICGPSGAGKSTLVKELMSEYKDSFGFSVSHTSREPRDGEVNGTDYYFSSVEEMNRLIEEDKFIETAEFSGNIYGTTKGAVKNVLDRGRICILDLNIEGVKNIKSNPDLKCVYVFIRPPSLEILEERLRSRGTDSEESIQRRLSNADDELRFADLEENFDKIIVNDDLNSAYQNLKSFLKPFISTNFE